MSYRLRNTQVLRYCFYLWIRLDNNRFEKLRDFLTLPSQRTLHLMKARMPVNGIGFQLEIFEALKKLFDKFATSPDDYEIILSWDATGYNKTRHEYPCGLGTGRRHGACERRHGAWSGRHGKSQGK